MAVAGTVPVSEERSGRFRKITWAWTCTAGGSAIKGTPHTATGKLVRLVTVPAAAGDAPTDNYDVTILDQDGTDVLMGAGANRDTADTEQVAQASLGIVVNDTLELNVANAGNAKKGTVYLYLDAGP
jgi:hypothetical protein